MKWCSTSDLGYSSGMDRSVFGTDEQLVREYPVLDTGPETVYNRIRWFSIGCIHPNFCIKLTILYILGINIYKDQIGMLPRIRNVLKMFEMFQIWNALERIGNA
ncbi:hypothetical protein RIR_jg8971.t1 [Rhizophagus irregularis DAOM 181602=DAOM 197198]|nr:hypothetical protein RIR_jg8971.t1 [Rhizophagus irregularis DAOM 181602=DAOM 197198]